MRNNKPAYKHETYNLYLFYAGWWKVDTSAIYSSLDTNARGFIRSELDVARPELVNPGDITKISLIILQYQSHAVRVEESAKIA